MGFAGFLNNPFGDDMVTVCSEAAFFAGEFLEMPFGRLGPALLQALTKGMIAFACLLNRLTTKGFTLAISSKVDNAQVNPQCSVSSLGCWCRNIQGHRQIEVPLAVEQVCLSLDAAHTSLLIVPYTQRDQYPPIDSQEGHHIESFKRHHTGVIDESALWPKRGFDALITLVDFRYFTNAPDSQLSGKLVGRTQFTIHQLLQCMLVRTLLIKSYLCDVVSTCIKLMHGLKQSMGLFFSRCKLQEHRLSHRTSIL